MLKASFDFKEVAGKLDKLTKAAEDSVRPAAQAGAQKFYDQAKANAPVSDKAHMFHGTHAVYGPYRPGNLRDSIYQVYSKDNSGQGKATYHIAWNHEKAPYGFMVEFGTSKAPAHPFLRPAYTSRLNDAMEATKKRMLDEVKKAL